MESYNDVHRVTKEILMAKGPTVYAKPYNFVDFKKHGSSWSPEYFSIVRDPIEKVGNTLLFNLLYLGFGILMYFTKANLKCHFKYSKSIFVRNIVCYNLFEKYVYGALVKTYSAQTPNQKGNQVHQSPTTYIILFRVCSISTQ